LKRRVSAIFEIRFNIGPKTGFYKLHCQFYCSDSRVEILF